MKRTLILTAALSAAGVATSMAQVYSVNAVGYVNQNIPANFSMIANPFKNATNTLNALLDPNLMPGAGIGVSFYRFANGNFVISTVDPLSGGVWLGPDGLPNGDTESVIFGDGGFILNTTTPFTVTWVGEVEQGTPIQTPIPTGLSIKSSKVPQSGKIQSELGFPGAAGDVCYKWDVGIQNFKLFTSDSLGGGTPGDWLNDQGNPEEPSLGIAESVFILTEVPKTWSRNFTVN